jgi:hypothetical protein
MTHHTRSTAARLTIRIALVVAACAVIDVAPARGQTVTPPAAGPAQATTAGSAAARVTRRVGAQQDLKDLLFLRSSDGKAVIRFAAGPLELISVGDRLGRNRATVKEIEGGRLVVEEDVAGLDGPPNRALIIFTEGQKGGLRYLRQLDEQVPVGLKPRVIGPQIGKR